MQLNTRKRAKTHTPTLPHYHPFHNCPNNKSSSLSAKSYALPKSMVTFSKKSKYLAANCLGVALHSQLLSGQDEGYPRY